MKYNLTTIIYMMGILGILIIVNTILGIKTRDQKIKFSWKKLFSGILNGIIFATLMISFSFALELIPIVFERIDITFPDEIITITEVFLLLVMSIKQYGFQCYEKFQKILEKNE